MLHAWGHPWREASFILGSTRALLVTLSLWAGGWGGRGKALALWQQKKLTCHETPLMG